MPETNIGSGGGLRLVLALFLGKMTRNKLWLGAGQLGTLKIQLIGDFSLEEDGVRVDLPPSKKARALLAYLIATKRPQRRERLCELFWEMPNDPKGSLRWALSKLRKSFSEGHRARLFTDRERVAFNWADIISDMSVIKSLCTDEAASKVDALAALAKLDQEFLAGTDLPNLEAYSLWLASEREGLLDLKEELIQKCLTLPNIFPNEEMALSKTWLDIRPFSQAAAQNHIRTFQKQGKIAEANKAVQLLEERFRDAGLELNVKKEVPKANIAPEKMERSLLANQKIQFCKTPSGVTLAYARVGDGPPLVKAANWLTHLELDWSAPIWSPLYRELAQDFTFIRYDERGNGLSDWEVKELSQKTFVNDLECVVDHMGLEKFPLLGISQGAAVSIDYAIKHPHRVSKLILFGAYAKGWRVDATPEITQVRNAMMTLTKAGWGQHNPAYRHIFSSTFMPGATSEQLAWFDDFQRQTTSPDNAVKFLEAFADIDVRHQLRNIKVPTLVIHSRGDQRIDWNIGRDIAAEIPNAEFVTIESDNHLLLEGEPAADQFLEAVREFLKD